jgi:hypothetical protein
MNILKSAARLFGVAFSAASILFVVGAFAITQYPAAVDGAMTRLMFADYPPALQARLGALGKQTVWLRQPEISHFVRPCV